MAEVSPIKPKEQGKKQSDSKNPESSDEVIEERCYYSEQKGSKKIQNEPFLSEKKEKQGKMMKQQKSFDV